MNLHNNIDLTLQPSRHKDPTPTVAPNPKPTPTPSPIPAAVNLVDVTNTPTFATNILRVVSNDGVGAGDDNACNDNSSNDDGGSFNGGNVGSTVVYILSGSK